MRISDWSSDVCSSDLRRIALFGDADQDGRAVDHRRVAQHDAAFVERIERANALGLQLRGRRDGARTAGLLVMARHQIDAALRLEALLCQSLDRLAQSDQRSLVVSGAAAPYRLFRDRPGAGPIFPFLLVPPGPR